MRALVTMRSAGVAAGRWAPARSGAKTIGAANKTAARSVVRGMAKSIELGHEACGVDAVSAVQALETQIPSLLPMTTMRNSPLLILVLPLAVSAQGPGARPATDTVSAPISNVAYEVTFDK